MIIKGKSMRFDTRSLITFFTCFGFGLTVFSGFILYITPHGRIAYWTNWHFLGLGKDQWEAVHTIAGLLFLVTGSFHLYFNWRLFARYLSQRTKELLVAVSIVILAMMATIAGLPPFSSIMTLSERIKSTWAVNKTPPPIPHLELLSLRACCQKFHFPLKKVLAKLEAAGIKVSSPAQTLKDIARQNQTSPQDIFSLMQQVALQTNLPLAGYGRMSLKEICKKLHIPLEEALKKLKAKGITANPQENLREIGQRVGLRPVELVEVIKERR